MPYEGTGLSAWAMEDRVPIHRRHVELARAFLLPSTTPYAEGMRGPALDSEKRERLLSLLRAGRSKRSVAHEVGCHRTTVYRYAREAQEVGHATTE